MYTGPLEPASIYGTWAESIQIWDIETDTPMDLTDAVEIKLILRDPVSRFDEATLKLSTGDITVPDTGIISWEISMSAMSQLTPKTYKVILLLIDEDGLTVPVMIANLSVVE